MKNILWNSGALVIGFLVSGIVITAVQIANNYFFPLPAGVDITALKDLESLEKVISVSAMLRLELSYILGSFVAGYTLCKLAASNHFILAAVLGCLLTGVNVLNIMNIPHPLWMIVLTSITFIPFTLIGCFVSHKW